MEIFSHIRIQILFKTKYRAKRAKKGENIAFWA